MTAFAVREGGVAATPRLLLRLDKRLELLDRRLTEQEALLARFRESLGMPQRQSVLKRSPPPRSMGRRATALAGGYLFGVFARLIVTGLVTVLALALIAAGLRLISK